MIGASGSDLAALDGIESLGYASFEHNSGMCLTYLERWTIERGGTAGGNWVGNGGC